MNVFLRIPHSSSPSLAEIATADTIATTPRLRLASRVVTRSWGQQTVGGLTFGTHEFDVRRSDASDRFAFASSRSAAARVSRCASEFTRCTTAAMRDLLVAETSVVAGRAVPTVRLSGVVQVAFRLASSTHTVEPVHSYHHLRAWARSAVVGSAATSITVVATLAGLAVNSLGVVLAKLKQSSRCKCVR